MILFDGLRSTKELPVKELSIFRSSVMFKLFLDLTSSGPISLFHTNLGKICPFIQKLRW